MWKHDLGSNPTTQGVDVINSRNLLIESHGSLYHWSLNIMSQSQLVSHKASHSSLINTILKSYLLTLVFLTMKNMVEDRRKFQIDILWIFVLKLFNIFCGICHIYLLLLLSVDPFRKTMVFVYTSYFGIFLLSVIVHAFLKSAKILLNSWKLTIGINKKVYINEE